MFVTSPKSSSRKSPSALTRKFAKQTIEIRELSSPYDPWVVLQRNPPSQKSSSSSSQRVEFVEDPNPNSRADLVVPATERMRSSSLIDDSRGQISSRTPRARSVSMADDKRSVDNVLTTFNADGFSKLHELCATNASMDMIKM
jgi:hypothetical protein